MRLSEAILLGTTILKHTHSTGDPMQGTGCALQLAAATVGSCHRYGYVLICQRHWPWLSAWTLTKIAFRNDALRHPAQRIADYVRSIEPDIPGEAVCGEGPSPRRLSERAELLKVKAEELETMPR